NGGGCSKIRPKLEFGCDESLGRKDADGGETAPKLFWANVPNDAAERRRQDSKNSTRPGSGSARRRRTVNHNGWVRDGDAELEEAISGAGLTDKQEYALRLRHQDGWALSQVAILMETDQKTARGHLGAAV